MRYGKWTITHRHDAASGMSWLSFAHDDYDPFARFYGPADPRSDSGQSFDEAKAKIDEIEAEIAEERKAASETVSAMLAASLSVTPA